jgi:recombination associated protein RdgC
MIKNAIVYKITDGYDLDVAELNELTTQPQHQYADPSGSQTEKFGWLPMEGSDIDGGAVISGAGIHRLLFRFGKRDVPGSVINYELSKQLEVMKEEGEDVDSLTRKQLKEMKESIYEALLPKAFIKVSDTALYIVPKDGLMYVCTSNAKTADLVISALRDMLGSLGVVCFQLNENTNLTSWFLEKSAPAGELSIGLSADLKDMEGGSVKVTKRLLNGELPSYAYDMEVQKLELKIGDRLTFSLNKMGHISKIDLSEENEEESDGVFDIVAEMILNHDTIQTIISELESQ